MLALKIRCCKVRFSGATSPSRSTLISNINPGLSSAQREQYESLAPDDWASMPDPGEVEDNDWVDCDDHHQSESHELRSIRSLDHITGQCVFYFISVFI